MINNDRDNGGDYGRHHEEQAKAEKEKVNPRANEIVHAKKIPRKECGNNDPACATGAQAYQGISTTYRYFG